jgi:hypothetical protein
MHSSSVSPPAILRMSADVCSSQVELPAIGRDRAVPQAGIAVASPLASTTLYSGILKYLSKVVFSSSHKVV